MLILHRKVGQSIYFKSGELKIEIKMLERRGNYMKCGIEASQRVEITRDSFEGKLKAIQPELEEEK